MDDWVKCENLIYRAPIQIPDPASVLSIRIFSVSRWIVFHDAWTHSKNWHIPSDVVP